MFWDDWIWFGICVCEVICCVIMSECTCWDRIPMSGHVVKAYAQCRKWRAHVINQALTNCHYSPSVFQRWPHACAFWTMMEHIWNLCFVHALPTWKNSYLQMRKDELNCVRHTDDIVWQTWVLLQDHRSATVGDQYWLQLHTSNLR